MLLFIVKNFITINNIMKNKLFEVGVCLMRGETVVYNDEIYTVIYDYGNGQLEIKKENSNAYYNVELVKKEVVRIF